MSLRPIYSARNQGWFFLSFSFLILLSIFFPLRQTAQAAQVTVAWDLNSETDLSGYIVHYGTVSRNYQAHMVVGNNTRATISNLQAGVTYYIAVTAYDRFANESDYSNEVSYSTSLACTYTLSPTSQSVPSTGGTGLVSVTAPPGCSWTAVSNAYWLMITSNSSRVASGTVNFSVSANSTAAARSGTLSVAGKTFIVNQSAPSCSFAISPGSQALGSGGYTGTIAVTAQSGCSWTARSNVTWISITSGSSGSGSGSVRYSVSANSTAAARSGTLSVAGKTFIVNQSAP